MLRILDESDLNALHEQIRNFNKPFGEIIVEKHENILKIFSKVGKDDFTHEITLHQSGLNHLISMGTVTVGEYSELTADDVSPVYLDGIGTIGGNHGFLMPKLTLNGQMPYDVGTVWTDGTNDYILLKVNGDGTGFFGCMYRQRSHGGYCPISTTMPKANLTHKSGVTLNTGTISISGGKVDQLYPAVKSVNTKVLVNGWELEDNTTVLTDKVTISEEYTILSYKGLIDYALENAGHEINPENVLGLMKITNIFCFSAGGKCTLNTTLTALEDLKVRNYQPIQANPKIATGGILNRYINGVNPVNGYDFKNNTTFPSLGSVLSITTENLIDSGSPCNRAVDTLTLNGEKLVVFTVGLFPDKSHAKDSERIVNSSTLWNMSTNRKQYPYALWQKEIKAGGCYSFAGYRCYNDTDYTVTNCNAVELGDVPYVFIDSHTEGSHKCVLPEKYIGRSINILSSEGITFNSDIITGEGILFTSGSYGTAVITLN